MFFCYCTASKNSAKNILKIDLEIFCYAGLKFEDMVLKFPESRNFRHLKTCIALLIVLGQLC